MNTRLLVPIARRFLFVVLITLTALGPAPRAHAATVTVSDCSAPSGAPGRLVEVVTAAAAGDTVTFSCSGTITLTTEITIDKNLTLDGAGQSVAISGGDAVRVFTVNTGRTFNLQNLSVTHGTAPGDGNSGGGVNNSGTLNVANVTFSGNSAGYAGGGIYSTGALNVTNSIFSGNSVGGGFGGGIAIFNGTSAVMNSAFTGNSGGYGGGISNWQGTSAVMNVTFSGNSGTYGGGLYNADTLNVINSTFSGNSTNGHGGGMYELGGTATVTNSTFSGNASSVAGTGGIYSNGSVTLKNTIVVNNTPWNCQFAITDGGGNLQFGGINANSCGATIPTADPKLGALADNGGPTQTMALGAGSAAVDAAVYATCMAAVGAPNYGAGGLDQRGQPRTSVSSVCDIGAFERQAGDSIPTTIYLPLVMR